MEQMALELRLTPLTVLLRSVLDQLQDKDPARIFAQPVSLTEVGAHVHCCSQRFPSCALVLFKMCVRVCGHVGVRVWTRTCVWTRVGVRLPVRVWTCVRACVRCTSLQREEEPCPVTEWLSPPPCRCRTTWTTSSSPWTLPP